MKKLVVLIALLFTTSAFGAGTIVEQAAQVDNNNHMHVRTILFTGDASGGTVPDLELKNVDGYIMKATTVPGIQGLFTLVNSLRDTLNAHAADSDEHATAADTVNFPVSEARNSWGTLTSGALADATDVGTLLRLAGALLTAYDVHDDDAELSSDWAYHIAQEGGDASPTSAETPDTIAEAITRLNDLRTKINTHDADSTAHTTGSTHQESAAASGSDKPTALYDITLLDDNGRDAAEGNLADRSATVVEEVIYTAMPRYVNGSLVVDIDNTTANSATGLLILDIWRAKN